MPTLFDTAAAAVQVQNDPQLLPAAVLAVLHHPDFTPNPWDRVRLFKASRGLVVIPDDWRQQVVVRLGSAHERARFMRLLETA